MLKMKYLFILGRNTKLSEAEILAYLEREEVSVISKEIKQNALLVETSKEINTAGIISNLGGTIAIGKVLISGSIQEIIKYIRTSEIYFGEETNFPYSILNFSSGKIEDEIKKKFKQEKLKASLKPSGLIQSQNHEFYSGSPDKLNKHEVNYFLFEGKEFSFGIIQAVYNTKEEEKRDMEKPERRQELAISPRLAKILINLSQVEENEILIDPFCGIGVILQEALLQNINVLGIDINRQAVKSAEKNILWLRKNYNTIANSRLINADSRNIKLNFKAGGIACEPSLSVLLKEKPTRQEAERIINNYENLMISVLNNIKNYLKEKGKIAFTSPLIMTEKTRLGCNIIKICENTGLKPYSKNTIFPIQEFRTGQIVGREIWVLRKE